MSPRNLISRAPPSAWLGAIVVGSLAFLALGGAAMPQPVVFADELHYSGAAERLGAGARPVADYAYGLLYPLLIAPLYALLPSPPDAYVAVKVVNGTLFSLAAVPAYHLARRGARPSFALVAALLTVLVPARTSSYLVLTESLAYPLFLTAALLVVRMLERPSAGRQLAALGACVLAVEARRQLLVLLVVLPVAALLACWAETRQLGSAVTSVARRLTATWLVLAVGAMMFVARLLVSDDPLLGPYEALVRGYDPVEVAGWLRNHVAALGLLCAVAPLAALPFGLRECSRRGADPGRRALGAVTVAVMLVLLLQVAAFSSTPYGLERMHERYLLYVPPFVFAVFALWLEAGLPRPRPGALISAAIVTSLPLLLPARGPTNTVTDSPTLFALGLDAATEPGTLGVWGVELRTFHAVALAASALLALWFLLVHRQLAWFLVAAVVAVLALVNVRAHAFIVDFSHDLEAAAGASQTTTRPDWIDRATAHDDRITSLFVAPSVECPSREFDVARSQVRHARAEFFNTRIARVLEVGAVVDSALPRATVRIGPSGSVERGGRGVRVTVVLLDSRLVPRGKKLGADDGTEQALWRVDGPLDLRAGSQAALCSSRDFQ